MHRPPTTIQEPPKQRKLSNPDRLLLAASILLQISLALFFGHAYDMRIFMATGYLVGTGQNPYLAQDLSAVFHNSSFQGITTIGYPPPWALVLGVIYFFTYRMIPNFLLYNLAIKLPVIAANIVLAFLVAHLLSKWHVDERATRRAWLFMLFNPLLLLTSSAWGQFDPVVALVSLLSIILFSEGKLTRAAILLALAISLKPTALPLIGIAFIYLAKNSFFDREPRLLRRYASRNDVLTFLRDPRSASSLRRTSYYFAIWMIMMILFCVAPFIILRWDPSPILQHWNSHFMVGGGMSFMTFLEFMKWSYQLDGIWSFMGWVWVPALGLAIYALRPGIGGLKELLKKSAALILVFYLCRSWVSETNINLILPILVILTSTNELDRTALTLVWSIPLVFSFFNTSLAQLLFPSLPELMDQLLKFAVEHMYTRYALRTLSVGAWLIAGWWVALQCFKKAPAEV